MSDSQNKSLTAYLEEYAGARPIIHVLPDRLLVNVAGESFDEVLFNASDGFDTSLSPFIIIHGQLSRTMLLEPILGFRDAGDHLCVDADGWISNENAVTGVMGMSADSVGRRSFPEKPGTPTSHGWTGAHKIALLLGKQGAIPADLHP